MADKYNIAIVDDHMLFRKSLTVLIELFPKYKVIYSASNGKELVEQLNADFLPDIVLMDISMPVMDGYSTTVWLRNNYPAVKVLALSTMDSETAIIKMIRSGAKGYVLKDAEPEEWQLAFEEVMSSGFFYNEQLSDQALQSVQESTGSTGSKNEAALFAHLSESEIAFLQLVCTELAYKDIADKLLVGIKAVEGYRDALCKKLNIKTRVGLAMYAINNNLVSL